MPPAPGVDFVEDLNFTIPRSDADFRGIPIPALVPLQLGAEMTVHNVENGGFDLSACSFRPSGGEATSEAVPRQLAFFEDHTAAGKR